MSSYSQAFYAEVGKNFNNFTYSDSVGNNANFNSATDYTLNVGYFQKFYMFNLMGGFSYIGLSGSETLGANSLRVLNLHYAGVGLKVGYPFFNLDGLD